MSDARFDRIERSLDTLVAGQFALQVDVKELRAEVKDLRAGQDELRAGQAELRGAVEELRAGQIVIGKQLDRVAW